MKTKELLNEVIENGMNRGCVYVVSVEEHPDNYTNGVDFIEAACEECKDIKTVDASLGVEVQLVDRINHMVDEVDIIEEVSEVIPDAKVYRIPYEEDDITGKSYFNIDNIRNITDDEEYVEEDEEYMSEEEMDEWGY